MLLNKLIRIDFVFLAVGFFLNFMKIGRLTDGWLGSAAALFLLTHVHDFRHHPLQKKFY
jgi:hypothetical protein